MLSPTMKTIRSLLLASLLIPVLPLLVIGAGIWLLVRASRPQTSAIRLAR